MFLLACHLITDVRCDEVTSLCSSSSTSGDVLLTKNLRFLVTDDTALAETTQILSSQSSLQLSTRLTA